MEETTKISISLATMILPLLGVIIGYLLAQWQTWRVRIGIPLSLIEEIMDIGDYNGSTKPETVGIPVRKVRDAGFRVITNQ